MTSTWPASVFQHTLMAAELVLPGGSTGPHMTMHVSARVTGELDLELLDRAYDDLVARNDVLRTTMVADGDGWLQLVHEHHRVRLAVTDGRGCTPHQLDERWAATPVPADEAPLVRGHVARLDDGTHLVGLTFHHLHADPRSLDLAIAELGRLYTARVAGEPAPVPALQFGAYVEDQRRSLRSRLDDDRAYWAATLDGARPMKFAPDLRRDWSKPPKSGSFRVPVLDAAEAAALERWALRHRTSFFGALFTGFCLTMADRVDSRDVLVSTVFEQRAAESVGELIGPFIHTALLRVPVPAGADWDSLVPRVHEATIGAYSHAHVPVMEVLGMHPELLIELAERPAGLCVFQYLPSHATTEPIPFGDAEATVLPDERTGPTGDVGLMFRLHRMPEGDLVAHVTFDERDLDEELARAVFEEFAKRLAEPLA